MPSLNMPYKVGDTIALAGFDLEVVEILDTDPGEDFEDERADAAVGFIAHMEDGSAKEWFALVRVRE